MLARLLPIVDRAWGQPERTSGRSMSSSNDTAAAVTARDGELGHADQQIQNKTEGRGYRESCTDVVSPSQATS